MNEILKILFEISKEKELTNISIDYKTSYYFLKIKANGTQFSLPINIESLKSVQYQVSLYNDIMKLFNDDKASLYNKLMEGLKESNE